MRTYQTVGCVASVCIPSRIQLSFFPSFHPSIQSGCTPPSDPSFVVPVPTPGTNICVPVSKQRHTSDAHSPRPSPETMEPNSSFAAMGDLRRKEVSPRRISLPTHWSPSLIVRRKSVQELTRPLPFGDSTERARAPTHCPPPSPLERQPVGP